MLKQFYEKDQTLYFKNIIIKVILFVLKKQRKYDKHGAG